MVSLRAELPETYRCFPGGHNRGAILIIPLVLLVLLVQLVLLVLPLLLLIVLIMKCIVISGQYRVNPNASNGVNPNNRGAPFIILLLLLVLVIPLVLI